MPRLWSPVSGQPRLWVRLASDGSEVAGAIWTHSFT